MVKSPSFFSNFSTGKTTCVPFRNSYQTIVKGICEYLSYILYADASEYNTITEDRFPELFLFKEEISKSLLWLDNTDRLLVLAFCIEMTK